MQRTETGNYYYGARYYDPKVSVWLSVDPLAHKYPSLSPYVFTGNNPIMLVDPDGREIDGDPELISRTITNDVLITFEYYEKSNGEGVDVITGHYQINTVLQKENEEGQIEVFYQQQTITSKAEVDHEGNISSVSITEQFVEENSQGEVTNRQISNCSQDICSSNNDNLFKKVVMAAQNHRNENFQSVAKSYHSQLTEVGFISGTSSVGLTLAGIAAGNPVATGLGTISGLVSYGFAAAEKLGYAPSDVVIPISAPIIREKY